MTDHDGLIDAYFRALDEEEYEPLGSVFARDAIYRMPSETIEGVDDLVHYFRNHRLPRNTDHEIRRRIHDESASAVEGYVTGEMPETGAFEGRFVDLFEFDDGRIARMSVYSNFDIPESGRD